MKSYSDIKEEWLNAMEALTTAQREFRLIHAELTEAMLEAERLYHIEKELEEK